MKTHFPLQRACAVSVVFMLGGCSRPVPPTPAPRPVYVSTVRNEAGSQVREFMATVQPRVEADLAFRTGGRVAKRLVELGQTVHAGQPLAALDDADYALGVTAAMAQTRAAEAAASQAVSDAARFERLAADGSIPAADLERQRARASAETAQTDQARQQLELARRRLGYAVLTAPFDGVVTALRFEAGQVVAEGQPIVALGQPQALELVVDVPEALAPTLKDCQAGATVGNLGDISLALRLRELAPSASPQTRTYRARYTIVGLQPQSPLRIGMTATLNLVRSGDRPSALLPASALIASDGAPAVWQVDGASGALIRQRVTLLSQAGDSVRVLGLTDGARVVSVGAHLVDAGMKVRAVERPLAALEGIAEVRP